MSERPYGVFLLALSLAVGLSACGQGLPPLWDDAGGAADTVEAVDQAGDHGAPGPDGQSPSPDLVTAPDHGLADGGGGPDLPVGPCPHNRACGPAEALVERVIDGDTIVLTSGERVRYIGVDTPETSGEPEPWGPQATAFNRSLVEGATVYLDYEQSCLDITGRLLAYVYTGGDWSEGGLLVNAELLRQGLSYYYPFDEQAPPCRQEELVAAEQEARDAGRGLWRSCLLPQPPSAAAVVPATADNLRITEVFANPVGTAEKGAEWFELHVDLPSDQWVELADLRAHNSQESPGGDPFTSARGCTRLQGGGYYVVAGPKIAEAPLDVASEAPLDACWRFAGQCLAQLTEDLTLRNSDGVLALWRGEELVLAVEYGDTVEGASQQPAEEDWCVATRPYDEDWSLFGSPGLANPPCGTPFCANDEGEVVAATNPAPGELVITEILSDVPGSDTDATNLLQEWFEAHLLPETVGERHLVGLTVHKKSDPSDRGKALLVAPRDCLAVAPGDWILFGMSEDPALNGGLPRVDALLDGLLRLTGSNGHLELRRGDGLLIDAVLDYGPTADGVGTQLAPEIIAGPEPWQRNDHFEGPEGELVWCRTPQGGSPGQPNPPCP